MNTDQACQPEWVARLHALADAAGEAVKAAGWNVRAVTLVVDPQEAGVPQVTFQVVTSSASSQPSG